VRWRGIRWLTGAGLALLAVVGGAWLLPHNLFSLAVLHGDLPTDATFSSGTASCMEYWLVGKVAQQRGRLEEARTAWSSAMGCDQRYVELAQASLPKDAGLAERAASLYPEDARALFWMAETRTKDQTGEAIGLYQQVVTLETGFGLAWCRLGYLQTRSDLAEAVKSYSQCCRYDDPGSNGCWNAGRILEQLGDTQKAIEYYRMSRWDKALKRADELEKVLRNGGGQP
jgi:tetratricopeptide (TPR) repeat protein